MGCKTEIVGLALAAASLTFLSAQVAREQKVANLELHIHPKALVRGIPQAFTFLLVNTSGHDIGLPIPSIECWVPDRGSIQLQLHFTPLPSKDYPPESGRGCGRGVYDGPSVLERVKGWKILHAGESLSLEADQERLFYDGEKLGTYDFWATYSPPRLALSEQKMLEGIGIDFPRVELATARCIFTKTY